MSAARTPGLVGATLRSAYPIVIGFAFAYLMQTVVAVSIGDYYSKILIDIGIAIVLGVSLGWVVVQALKDEGLNTFSVSVPSIAIFVVAASVLGVLAAWFPARRAAKADILDAIATT